MSEENKKPIVVVGSLNMDLVVRTPEAEAIAAEADLAVLSLPNGLAARHVPELLMKGVRVVDLSADYRYRSLPQWQEVYAAEARHVPRSDGDLCREAVYGLVEWQEELIRTARLVAAPGCFPTASLLALLPFLKQGLIETGGIVIDAKSGKLQWEFQTAAARQNTGRILNPDGSLNQDAFAPVFGDFQDMYVDFYRYTLIGAIMASPVVDNGVVYIGSMDGNFYALQ
jgi:hypothetical protein